VHSDDRTAASLNCPNILSLSLAGSTLTDASRGVSTGATAGEHQSLQRAATD
jgi:hypothetical protein